MQEFTQNGGSVELLDKLKTQRPKKALSAYMIFVRENRSIVSQDNPELNALEVMKWVGQRWQDLTPITKKRYEDKADTDKNRYKQDLSDFEKEIDKIRKGPSQKKPKLDVVSENIKTPKATSVKKSKPKPVPKVPASPPPVLSKSPPPKKSPSLTKGKGLGRKKGRKKSRPGRPLSAYIFFSQEVNAWFRLPTFSFLFDFLNLNNISWAYNNGGCVG